MLTQEEDIVQRHASEMSIAIEPVPLCLLFACTLTLKILAWREAGKAVVD